MDVTSRPFEMTTDPEDAMGSRDARVDAYIANAAAFAQRSSAISGNRPRRLPRCRRAIKWSFLTSRITGILCSMASFMALCLRFLNAPDRPAAGEPTEPAMGQFGRITSLNDLPSKKTITGYIKQAMKVNEAGTAAGCGRNRSGRKPAGAGGITRPSAKPEGPGTYEGSARAGGRPSNGSPKPRRGRRSG